MYIVKNILWIFHQIPLKKGKFLHLGVQRPLPPYSVFLRLQVSYNCEVWFTNDMRMTKETIFTVVNAIYYTKNPSKHENIRKLSKHLSKKVSKNATKTSKKWKIPHTNGLGDTYHVSTNVKFDHEYNNH